MINWDERRKLRDELIRQHNTIESVVQMYMDSVLREYEKDPLKYEKYVDQFIVKVEELLFPHLVFEETEIFPLLKGHPLIDELLSEHKLKKNLLIKAKHEKNMMEKIKILNQLLEVIKKHLVKENSHLACLLY